MSPPVPVPRYGEASLADVMPSMLAALGVRGAANTLDLPATPRACVLVIDGLGLEQLRDQPDTAPYLSSLLPDALTLTAGFPATTAASLGSLGTGLPPGEHGLVGYLVAVPGEGRLMNSLRWDDGVDPVAWQPRTTVFERAMAGGVVASQVAAGVFKRSGLTRATMRGGRYVAADSAGELVAGAAAALRADDRALAYVYYPDLDATGHRVGCGSEAWRFQLAHVDRLAEQLASVLPPDAVLYITADHGMVDVLPDRRVDADAVPELREGVTLLGGEARARHVYTRRAATPDVLAAWREVLGDRMWVVAREEATAAGWFGSEVSDEVVPRIGDVIATAHDDVAVVATRTEPRESTVVGMHGSMTSTEQLVPLLRVVGSRAH
ncbi:MAG: alkaline phosphatase family protein [Streptosporangiaceae bacterium]